MPQESKVGRKLTDLTTRKVILVVLVMLFSVPLFKSTTYYEFENSLTIGI